MTNTTRASAAAAALALFACHLLTLRGMYAQWMTDEDMAHGVLVPLVVLWVLWREKGRWNNESCGPDPWGLPIVAMGAVLHIAGVIGAGLFASSLALVVSLGGMVVCFGGFRLLLAWAFPFCLMAFMLPKLAIVYNQITLPMQLLASKLAAGALTAIGSAVALEGNIIEVGGRRIEVAEACSGIRYVMPLSFVAVFSAYLFSSKWWMRVVLLACAVPISIGANALRVALIATNPAFESGTPHTLVGIAIFSLCLLMLAVCVTVSNRLYARLHS